MSDGVDGARANRRGNGGWRCVRALGTGEACQWHGLVSPRPRRRGEWDKARCRRTEAGRAGEACGAGGCQTPGLCRPEACRPSTQRPAACGAEAIHTRREDAASRDDSAFKASGAEGSRGRGSSQTARRNVGVPEAAFHREARCGRFHPAEG